MTSPRSSRGLGLMDIICNEARFSRFTQAIRSAGVGEKFLRANNCTIFAPTDAAFARLPWRVTNDLYLPGNLDQLRRVVLLHLMPMPLSVAELSRVAAIRTIDGQELIVRVSADQGKLTLGNARVCLPAESATNGILYPVDDVLQPSALLPAGEPLAAGYTVLAPVRAVAVPE